MKDKVITTVFALFAPTAAHAQVDSVTVGVLKDMSGVHASAAAPPRRAGRDDIILCRLATQRRRYTGDRFLHSLRP